jgi:hypothetical protein
MIPTLCMSEMSPPIYIVKKALFLTNQRLICKGSYSFLVKSMKSHICSSVGYNEAYDSELSKQIDAIWMQLKKESVIIAERRLLVDVMHHYGLSSTYCYDAGSHYVFLFYKSYDYQMVWFGSEVIQSLMCGHLPTYNGLYWSIVKC